MFNSYKMPYKNNLLCVFLMALLFLSMLQGSAQAISPDIKSSASPDPAINFKEDFVVGRVLNVTAPTVNQNLLNGAGLVSKQQTAKIQVLEGPYKDLVTSITNEVTDNPAYNIDLKPGSEVILSITSAGDKPEINISDYHRAPAIYILLLVFLAVFLVLGGKTGLKALAGLVITVLLITYVLLPLSIAGVYPLVTAIFICLVATIASMLFICGPTRKATAAIFGTAGGVLVAGIVASLVIKYAPLTGLSSEEAQILRGSMLIVGQKPAFYSGLLAAGMLIGALGVIMDVAISIASSVSEMAKVNKNLTTVELYKSGMNIGKDIMGTMTNTLILAYTGGALPLLLLVSQMPCNKLINLDLLATEIASALSGGLGLILTIPLTAFASSYLMKRQLE
jgi:uncharacterized membrane protein